MKKLFIIAFLFISLGAIAQKVNPKDFYGITYSALTFGTTTTWDYQTGSHKTLTLTGNSTLSITNAFSGASGVLIVTQDGTGSRTLAVPNGTVVLNSGASESTTIAFSYDGSTFHWAGGKNKRALDTLYQDGDTLRYTINGTAYAIYNKATGGAIANGNYGNVQLNRNSALSGSDSLTVDSSTFKTKNTFQQGNNINNIKILTREIPATSGATSYANTGGTGDRTASITVTQSGTNIIVPNGNNLNVLVNGNTTESLIWFSGSPSGTWFQFDFGSGNQYIIDEIKFYQSTTNSHGTWKVQGSNDGSSFTDIGSSFTLGGFTTQTITALAGNSTAYRYYRFTGVSGSTSSTPFIREFEFKIGTAGGGTADSTHAKIYTNTTGIAIADTGTKKVAVGTHVFDSTFKVEGSTNLNGHLRVGTVDSIGSPINLATFDANGNLKKTAVSSGGTPTLNQYLIPFGNASNQMTSSLKLQFDADSNILHNGITSLGSGYGFQSSKGFYYRKDGFDYFYYDPSTSNAEIKLSSSTGTFDVTKAMQGNYGFRVKNSSSGSIDFGGQTGTGFAPYMIMRPDRTLQNHGLISVIADDTGTNPAMILSVATSSATAFSTKDLFAFYNNTDTVAKAKANGTWLFYNTLKYKANYGSSFDARSLVDKNYVDSIVATVSGSTPNLNAVTAVGNTSNQDINIFKTDGAFDINNIDDYAEAKIGLGELFFWSGKRGYLYLSDSANNGTYLSTVAGSSAESLFLPASNGDTLSKLSDVRTAVAGSSKTLDVQYTDASNSGTGETDLLSYTLPANTLLNVGDRVEVEAIFTTPSNADAKDLKFYFGTYTHDYTSSTISSGTTIKVRFTIIKTASSAQRLMEEFTTTTSTKPGYATATQTDTSTIVLKFTGQCDASTDITQRTMTVTYYKAP